MSQKWVSYLVGVSVLLALFWSIAAGWFHLQYRVVRLEEAAARYFHRVVHPPPSQ